MGGNALAVAGAKRVPKAVAFTMLAAFTEHLEQLGSQAGRSYRTQPVEAYRTKADFGDLDVMVDSLLFQDFSAEQVVGFLSDAYGHTLPYQKNGPVLSVGLPLEDGGYLQADLLSTPAETFDFAWSYLSWNDLGNLVGRVAAKMGLKFGTKGLTLPLRDEANVFGELLVTLDFGRALSFLGFSGERWGKGFEIAR